MTAFGKVSSSIAAMLPNDRTKGIKRLHVQRPRVFLYHISCYDKESSVNCIL